MTTNTALALDDSRVYAFPPRDDTSKPMDPLTAEAPVTVEEPPDAVLNRPKAKRQRKAKTGKKRGRPAQPKTPAEQPKQEEPLAQQLATPPHGNSLPNVRFNPEAVFTLMTIVWVVAVFGAGLAVGYFVSGSLL